MKLKKFSVKGFRSLKDVSWEPGNLNVLIGPNGSGKTNLLRALEFLREAATNDLEKTLVAYGGFTANLWDSRAHEMEFKVDVHANLIKDNNKREDELHYELMLHGPSLSPFYEVNREILWSSNKGVRESIYVQRLKENAFILDSENKQIDISPERMHFDQTLVSQIGQPISNLTIFFFSNFIGEWQIFQQFNISQDAPVRKAAVTRRESSLQPNGDNLISVLHTLYTGNRKFKSDLNDAMRAAFGNDFEELEFPPAEDQRIQMRVRWKHLKVSHSTADLSEGTLKFLMLVALLANSERSEFFPSELIAIDEPETYLHPSMFPVLAELAAEASKAAQIIFTTHSPEFLTAIGVHNPQTTIMQNIHGETKLSNLDGNELKRWLEKYKLGELFVAGDLEALA